MGRRATNVIRQGRASAGGTSADVFDIAIY